MCVRFYGSREAGSFLRLYALLIPMLYSDAITDAMTKGLGQQTACVRYNIITSFLDVVFLYLLLPRYGMAGYYLSFLVTHLLNFILSLRRLLKISGVRIPFYIPVLTLSAVGVSLWIASHTAPPLFQAVAYPAVLLSLLCLTGVIRREDLSWLTGLIRKK